ncbi:signal recognition particle-docking protein FtsY [Adlercreutzia caecimuris]|uniref:signal recognition particle-docking protein FtsY n=1 Tax=Adlercreutzia caecimuris TaxID=671266 RepID=UPI00214CC76C|nr:signal recognition particle-docking protein FtsY [Adlercreutzia caecimuris]MCR2036737.1 signal recognition particle-docking protein FtsY [Adlercreutzia caecimuris]
MGLFDRINEGLARSRDKFKESMNVLLDRGPDLDEEFWEGLEETLILSDVGGAAAADIVERLRDLATRRALPDAYAVLDLLNDEIAATFTEGGEDIFGGGEAVVLFVGINGTGKTTTVGKLAKASTDAGRAVILGSADTFRAAAIEQLEVWARRSGVEMVTRERGADPASVCYDTLERAEATGADLVLIDTAGRLHTSADLMRELEKVVNVVRKRSKLPVYTVLVIDATTGQNGLQQAREFNRALDLDALIVTKLDGTAKGGIALAVSHDLELPIVKIGVGEGIDDLRDFNAREFAAALVGAFDERFDEDGDSLRGENAKEAAVTAGERRRDVLEGAPAATAEVEVAAEAGEDVADAEPAADAEAGVVAADAEAAAPAGIAEAGVAGEPVIDEQGDVEEALVEAAEEMVAEPADGDLVEAALGRRTHETIVAEVADEPADEEGDGTPFTDDELAELALAADENGEGAEEAGEPEPAPEPEKKSFWKRLFD